MLPDFPPSSSSALQLMQLGDLEHWGDQVGNTSSQQLSPRFSTTGISTAAYHVLANHFAWRCSIDPVQPFS